MMEQPDSWQKDQIRSAIAENTISVNQASRPQILADQLTLSQPRGADYAHHIILAPPDFQTFLRPWLE